MDFHWRRVMEDVLFFVGFSFSDSDSDDELDDSELDEED